jgi:hypothetical protein
MTGAANMKRVTVAAALVLLIPVGSQLSALALSATAAVLLGALALWELRTPARHSLGTRRGSSTDARGARSGELQHVQQHQEGSS